LPQPGGADGQLTRVELSSLPAAEQHLSEIGRAAGRPWRRIEKDAARAAITLLRTHPPDHEHTSGQP
jgi:hypothetical protein